MILFAFLCGLFLGPLILGLAAYLYYASLMNEMDAIEQDQD